MKNKPLEKLMDKYLEPCFESEFNWLWVFTFTQNYHIMSRYSGGFGSMYSNAFIGNFITQNPNSDMFT